IDERVILGAANNRNYGLEIMSWLLDRDNEVVIPITEAVLAAVLKNEERGAEMLQLILDRRRDDVQVTPLVLEGLQYACHGMMELLLQLRGDDIQVTGKLLRAAAENRNDGETICTPLRRNPEVEITENILLEATENTEKGLDIMERLLIHCGPDFGIGEMVVIKIAENPKIGLDMMKMLLSRQQAGFVIFEEVLEAAAQNGHSGREMLKLLTNNGGMEIPITEGIVSKATGNMEQAVLVMEYLLDLHRNNLPITQKVLSHAACTDWYDNTYILQLLFPKFAGARVTGKMFMAAALLNVASINPDALLILFDQRGNDISVTENVVFAALDGKYPVATIRFIMGRLGSKVPITDEILVKAATTEKPTIEG
ncbi:hypothetical protein BO71DRAFT_328447, partial [Aspergillus ellipticus CBS 707.79]